MNRVKLVVPMLAIFVCVLAPPKVIGQTLQTLAAFNGTDGQFPVGNLTLSGSTLYGTTNTGGANNRGEVFSEPVAGGTPTVLYSFDSSTAYGGNPGSSLTLVGSYLYGMTSSGGAYGLGTIFREPIAGGTPTTLYSFSGGTAGGYPVGGLTLSADGTMLYGMTPFGGVNGAGNIFSEPIAGGTPTVLASFNNSNGQDPQGDLTLVGSTLYGLTNEGGSNGLGVIFEVPVTGGTPTALASFNGLNGESPSGDLVLASGKLYGMTDSGGTGGQGTLFSIPVGIGGLTTLVNFNYSNGASPMGSLTLVGSTLYGMTQHGGTVHGGNIFSIPVGGNTPTNLYSFTGTNGAIPVNSLTASGSTFYGMTEQAGTNNDGTIFALYLAPEPSSLVLLVLGMLSLGATALRKRVRKRA